MKAAISWQTLQILANSYLRAKAWEVVDMPPTSANCLQSHLSGSSCWSKSETLWHRSCQPHANGRGDMDFPISAVVARLQTSCTSQVASQLLKLLAHTRYLLFCLQTCRGFQEQLSRSCLSEQNEKFPCLISNPYSAIWNLSSPFTSTEQKINIQFNAKQWNQSFHSKEKEKAEISAVLLLFKMLYKTWWMSRNSNNIEYLECSSLP